jgi:murein DD-endopeptidase MepM/ murein hydrolase activator NlpD
MGNRVRSRILIAFGAFVLCLALLIWLLSARSRRDQAQTTPLPAASPAATATPQATSSTTGEAQPASTSGQAENNNAQPSPSSPSSSPATPAATAPNTSTNTQMLPPAASSSTATLLVPVAGVRPEQLRDTFQEARSEGRVHDAIDIPAARGTPVLAAADGRIIKFFNSEKGGITIYQLSADERLVYYYAHLERYADGLTEGHYARRGEVIAYVGDTGNAGPGNYHLHFSVATITDPKRYWTGININPYPMLRGTP